MKDREKLMKKVQTADFELIEANLYLDAYTYCKKGLEYFYTARDRAAYLKKEYEEKYGPLTANANTGSQWSWTSSPWPWKCEG